MDRCLIILRTAKFQILNMTTIAVVVEMYGPKKKGGEKDIVQYFFSS